MKTDSENKRQHILAIAVEIFAKFGFAKTTLDDIADAVGMKKGSLYYYFESKEAIFSAVIHEVAKKIFKQMRENAESYKSAREAVLNFIETGLRNSRDTTNVIGVSAQVKLELLPLADKILKEFHDDILAFMAGIIDRGIEQKEFKPCDSKRIADSLHLVVQGIDWNALYTSSIHGNSDYDIEKIVDDILFLAGLILDGIRLDHTLVSTSS